MQGSATSFDAIAYVDEAGALGRTSRLGSEHDDDIGLFAAVLLEGDKLAKAADDFTPAVELFKASAPTGSRLHITDASASGNEAWARAADSAREEAYELVRRLRIPVIFEARRLRGQREFRDTLAEIGRKATEGRRSGIEVKARASKERIEENLLEMLLEKLEVYGEDARLNAIEVRFDDVDRSLFKSYEKKLDELRGTDDTMEDVMGYERATGVLHHGTVRTQIQGASAAVRRVAGLAVAGKNDPLVLLVDIVANSLNDYFRRLDNGRDIDELSTREWCLATGVWPKE